MNSAESFDVRCLHCIVPFLSMNSKTDTFVSFSEIITSSGFEIELGTV